MFQTYKFELLRDKSLWFIWHFLQSRANFFHSLDYINHSPWVYNYEKKVLLFIDIEHLKLPVYQWKYLTRGHNFLLQGRWNMVE